MQRSFDKGHPIIFVNEQWVYEDTREPIKDSPRRCKRCGKEPTVEGHDACLGTLPGINYACCGHGVRKKAYIQFMDGTRLSGFDARR